MGSSTQLKIPPEEDARLAIVEAEIEGAWRQWCPKYVRHLEAAGEIQGQIRQSAILCIQVLHQYEDRGLNPDQAREAIGALIYPGFDGA